MEKKDLQNILNNISSHFDLVNRAKKKCSYVIKKLIIDSNGDLNSIGGFKEEELIYEFNKQSFEFNSYLIDSSFVRTEIGIYIKDVDNVWVRGLEPVGKYELETNLDGEDIDDWLEFTKAKIKTVS